MSCAAFPCTVTIVLTAPDTVVVHAAAAKAHKRTKKKTVTVTLGKGRFTIKSKGFKKLSVKLSGRGKRFIRSHRGHVKITGLISETIEHHTVRTERKLTVTIKPPKRSGKK